MFAALGTFFGIIVPLIAYWLQVKSVEKYEARVEKEIHEATERAKNEFEQIINDIAVAERELDEKVKKNTEAMDGKIAVLLRHQSVSITKSIVEFKKQLIQAWESGKDGVELGVALVWFCGLLEECAYSSGVDKQLKDAADAILRVFRELRSNTSTTRHWKGFVAKLVKENKKTLFEFHFNEDLLGKETYREWIALCEELGIRMAGDVANVEN